MHKKYQVFVSSTYRDLQEERREVIQALLELECIPVGMELFPAADDAAWDYIKQVIDDCDYYVLVLGGRYGSTDETGIGFTEREYDYASAMGKPVIAFLHGATDQLPVEWSEIEPSKRERLKAFRAKVETRHLCKYWKTSAELGGLVARSWNQLVRRRPAEGWVRARFTVDPASLSELNDLRLSGVVRATTTANSFYKDIEWSSYLTGTSSLDVFFSRGHTWGRIHADCLKRLASKKGGLIRVILPDPEEKEAMEDIARRNQRPVESQKGGVLDSISFYRDLGTHAKRHGASVNIYLAPIAPRYTLFRMDDVAVVSLYTYSDDESGWIAFVCSASGLVYRQVQHEINSLLSISNPLSS